jgi:malate synthase
MPNTIEVTGKPVNRAAEILTPQALEFLAHLHERFAARRDVLLARRAARREALRAGQGLDFLPETAHIRADDWRVAPAPPDLADRRVEITGPTERKMAINALNSGAKVWLADLEDANTPHWHNVVSGQVNLFDAVRRQITYTSPEGRHYALDPALPSAVVVPRPRGWHLPERHLLIDGRPAVGALVDFGLYFFHNARELLARGSGPYFYLPKLESHLEARLWNDVFNEAQDYLDIPRGTVRATVLIETIPAAFEMTEILYELREHASGLNAGRWDYLFSIIKNYRDAGERFVLPDRDGVSMTVPFMRAYTELLVRTCHERGAFAIGGMAAFIPSRRDPEVNERALAKVRADKQREAGDGFDGSWVAHPGLVPICRAVFDQTLGERPNQLERTRADVHVTADKLLDIGATPGAATMAGLRAAVDVGVRYLASWLAGTGAAAIHNLMEDAATAEISRSQVWQWTRNAVRLETGETVTPKLVRHVLAETRAAIGGPADGSDGLPHLEVACELFEQIALSEEFADFLTLPAYERID